MLEQNYRASRLHYATQFGECRGGPSQRAEDQRGKRSVEGIVFERELLSATLN
jgi:hypothetical protein